MMKPYSEMTVAELSAELVNLKAQYKKMQSLGMQLNMSRGVPCQEQLDLSMGMMDVLYSGSDLTCEDGTDCRNYGSLTGIEEARVRMENARREEERYARLLQEDAVTPQQYDQVHTAYLAAQARHEQMQRQRQSLSSVKTEQGHHLSQNAAAVQVARAAVDLARLQLSYTVIVATADGVVGRKEIHEGQLVQPGQTMVDIVDSSDLWVVANYRETQMQHIAVGSKVKVTVDAIPGVEFEGTVESISEATGSAFSIIPQDNATGNFVKVEQRLPVRIRLADHEALPRLRAGMNAECEVAY